MKSFQKLVRYLIAPRARKREERERKCYFRGSWNYENKKKRNFIRKEKEKIRRNVSFTINLRRHEISALCRPKGSSLKAFAITNGN